MTQSTASKPRSKPTCTDPHGLVHAIDGYDDTYCGWARVWADGEWSVNEHETHVTCLVCIVNTYP